jgi:5-methylcytosine-specific restriction endonuclease McrA
MRRNARGQYFVVYIVGSSSSFHTNTGGPAVHVHNEDQIIPALLRKFDDKEFIHQFEMIAGIEHGATIKMLHFINDLERRKTFLELGYSSVFDFCTRRIKYSSSQAGRRIQAARCCRRYPEFFGYLRNREVCIMTLAMIEGIITDDNHDEIVKRVRGASRRDVERLISEYRPAAALRDRIRYVHVPLSQPRDLNRALLDRSARRATPEEWRDKIPTQEKVFVQFLADEEFLNLFEEVRDLMGSHVFEDFAAVMKLVLKEYRERHSPAARKQRRDERKRATSPDSHRWEWKNPQDESTRHVPDEVRDEVFVRDQSQCTFVAPDGTRCQCKKGLQLDHINPYSIGGSHDLSNLRLLCSGHNKLAAENVMGRNVMQPYWRQ